MNRPKGSATGDMYFMENGVIRYVDKGEGDPAGIHGGGTTSKVLVHLPTNETITSYDMLEQKLLALGWERYSGNPNLLQFHKEPSRDLISLPLDFSNFKSVHMYDIIVKIRNNVFGVRKA